MTSNPNVAEYIKQQNKAIAAAEAEKSKNDNAYSYSNGETASQIQGGQSMQPPPLNIEASAYEAAKAGLLADLEGPNWGAYGQSSGMPHAMATYDSPPASSMTNAVGSSQEKSPGLFDYLNNPVASVLGDKNIKVGGNEWSLGPLSAKAPEFYLQSGDFNKNGNQVSGVDVGLTGGGVELDNSLPGFVNSGKLEGPALEYKKYTDENGHTVDWNNISGGSVSGKIGTKDPEAGNDATIEFGTGFGGGVGLDTMPTDQDKDGQNEYGPKVNTPGPSFDIKSEDPLKHLLLGIVGSKTSGSDSNWTNKATDWLPF